MEDEAFPNPGRRWRRILIGGILLLIMGFAILWTQRKPIARAIIDRALAQRGVDVQYRIGRFGLLSQTFTNVRIGDSRHPDLIAESAQIQMGLSGFAPTILAVKARGVRLIGRYQNGQLSLGALDRFMGPPSGQPFTLPDIRLELSDVRARIDTSAGPVGIAVDGAGRLSDGYDGRIAAIMPRISASGCQFDRPTAYLHLAVTNGAPALDGPIRARSIACGDMAVAQARAALDVHLTAAFDHWAGNALVESGQAAAYGHGAAAGRAEIAFEGTKARTQAHGMISFGGVRAAPDQIARVRTALAGLKTTPIGPIAGALWSAIEHADSEVTLTSGFSINAGANGSVALREIRLTSPNGARLNLDLDQRPIYSWPGGITWPGGTIHLSGGGLPEVSGTVHGDKRGYAGELQIAPYAAGDARLVLGPVRFGSGRLTTSVVADGPLADGRIEGLSMPVDARLGKDGSILINPSCVPLSFHRLILSSVELPTSKMQLCPQGGGVLTRSARGVIGGGARVPNLAIQAVLGATPLDLTARELSASITRPGFTTQGLAVRIGMGASATRLAADDVRGLVGPAGIGGSFDGLSGQIGQVPLLFSEGRGGWTLAGSALKLGGHLAVRDAATTPRFSPLESDKVGLELANGRIAAAGMLKLRKGGTAVTQVTISHDLSKGSGFAQLDVANLTFSKAFQPEMLTPLTLGVIADVRGSVAGRGRIHWSPNGVASAGDFHTDDMALAAAFGPVTGLKGQIHFSDLLGLVTPPGQRVEIAQINPGVAVVNGVVKYQLLRDQYVQIESGVWPFAGGELSLNPTLLDLGKASERHLTFGLTGMDAAQFVEQFEFKNIAVTGTFDGSIPIIFDATGGRIVGGRLAVRPGGGRLAYVGEISNAQLGRFGKMAFDALKSMKYDGLVIDLNGSLDGEIISKISFSGTNEQPVKRGTKGLMSQFIGLPFRFGITVNAPFRSLVNSAQSLVDPRGLIRQSLPIIQATPLPPSSVQPQESEPHP